MRYPCSRNRPKRFVETANGMDMCVLVHSITAKHGTNPFAWQRTNPIPWMHRVFLYAFEEDVEESLREIGSVEMKSIERKS